MARIRAVLFDIDGTLLDSNDAHAHAWIDALRGHGTSVPFETVRSKIGMGGDKLLRAVAGIDVRSPEGRSINERRAAVLKQLYLPDVGPLPGARVLVDSLRSRGLTCVVVTSSTAADVADLLRTAAVADLIDGVITSDDADRSKPDPDLVAVALHQMRIGPSDAILVGDTPFDVEAGTRAGVGVVAFRSGGWKDADLDGALAIYDGPADLARHLEQSVFARHMDDEISTGSYGTVRSRRSVMRGI